MDNSKLILVRHGEVQEDFQQICYGQMDVQLSQQGLAHSRQIAAELAELPVRRVFHSGLVRTRYLAELLGKHVNLPAVECAELQERNYGEWEGRLWDDIFNETGDDMNRLVSEPGSFSPAGGETTFQMRDRVLLWYKTLPADGLTVAVTHGGPIAALLGTLRDWAVPQWIELIPAYGQVVKISWRATLLRPS